MNARCVIAVAVLATGCDYLTGSFKTNGFSGDPYPINIESTSGAIVVGAQEVGTTSMWTAVLDVLSPITVIDRGADVPVSVGESTLTVFGALSPGGPLDHPRGRFYDKKIVTLHPCSRENPICEVGPLVDPRPFDAVIGIDAFASDALRIRLATDEIFIFPDIAGDDLHRSRACDAVLPSPFRGGGTLVLGGTEVSFTNRRIAIDTCIAPDPDPFIPQRERGVDALFVLSTAHATSIINESTYGRYRELDPTAADPSTLPESVVLLPSGPVEGRLTSLPSIALVGNLSSNPRAPCRQVYAHHLLATRNCAVGDDCPCPDNDTFCAVPAVVELAPTTRIPVLVVSDSNPTLQALRTELRPDRPEVDGILGTDVLRVLEIDVDYAHDRALARCTDRDVCGARVMLSDSASRSYIEGCLGDQPGPFP